MLNKPSESTKPEAMAQSRARSMMRSVLAGWMVALCGLPASAQDIWPRITPGTAVLLRHATAPGGGDPVSFQLNDCATQRNLSADGRAQALRMGEAFQRRSIEVTTVWTSQWCRTRETADLAFSAKRTDQPLFNSFFDAPERGLAQTRAALDLLASWRGPGVLVVVTHQVNITALTGIVPDAGEGVVIAMVGRELKVLGRITP